MLDSVFFHVYIVLLETRDDGTNRGRSKTSKKITDELIISRLFIRKGLTKMGHHIVERLVKQHLKFILAFAVHSNVTNRKSAVHAAIGKMPLPQRPPFISLK